MMMMILLLMMMMMMMILLVMLLMMMILLVMMMMMILLVMMMMMILLVMLKMMIILVMMTMMVSIIFEEHPTRLGCSGQKKNDGFYHFYYTAGDQISFYFLVTFVQLSVYSKHGFMKYFQKNVPINRIFIIICFSPPRVDYTMEFSLSKPCSILASHVDHKSTIYLNFH